jgi:hypothetical protein
LHIVKNYIGNIMNFKPSAADWAVAFEAALNGVVARSR